MKKLLVLVFCIIHLPMSIDPIQTKSYTQKHWFWQGFWGSSILLFFIYLVPRLTVSFFTIGFKDSALIILLLSFPLCALGLLLLLLNAKIQRILTIILKYAAAILMIFVSPMTQFEITRDSNPAALVYLLLLSITFYIALLDANLAWHKRDGLFRVLWTGTTAERMPFFSGMIFIFGIVGLVGWISSSELWMMGVIGLFYAFSPIGNLSDIISEKATEIPLEKSGIRGFQLTTLGTTLILILSLILYTAANYNEQSKNSWFGIIGIAIGLIVAAQLIKISSDFADQMVLWTPIFSFFGLVFCCILVAIDPPLLYSIAIGWSTGFILGFTILIKFFTVIPHLGTRKGRFGIGIFFLMILTIASSYGAYELQWPVRNNDTTIWFGIPIIGIIAGLGLFLIWLGISKITAYLKVHPLNPIHGAEENKQHVRSKVIIAALSLIMLVSLPLGIGLLDRASGKMVTIQLPQTMYLVDGTPVNEVTLAERSGIILLNSPDPTGIVHNEIIRQGKSIRLGGYFYGLDGLPLNESTEWIGNALDVYSLGMCNVEFKPENIARIQEINPLSRFYYMAFATTLFEDVNNNATNGTWYNSHYPAMKFNETMNEWTLKLIDGTEAYGVRRNPNSLDAHLMDLGQTDWADYFAWIYTQKVNEFHANGVAIDEVMWQGYWDTELENLRDYSSKEQIRESCYKWLERLDNQTNMEIITQAFWPSAQVHQNGVWGEIAFRAGGQYGEKVDDRKASVWYEQQLMDWEDIVADLKWQADRNQSYIWAAWYTQNDTAGLEYALSTYLMAKPNGCTSIVFQPHAVYGEGYGNKLLIGYSVKNVKEEVEDRSNYFDVEMGDALNEMTLKSGNGGSYWQRDFTNGMVLVNPFHAHVPGIP